ncbi:hypothetical protein BT96DRAFT_938105 [Gymnopus androsaceus JB14]|uniref:Uncharacterized protein n=1 Tax=Gymnopus androsaceus JB14 TaxID=1447944 RepID=A0A6A4HQE2_9AGAR|nr:hypothetical protein BT96DRAFT_938105 [Gymnopus androsaceus JB14]
MQDRGFKCCENILEPKNVLDPTWAEVYLALELHTDGVERKWCINTSFADGHVMLLHHLVNNGAVNPPKDFQCNPIVQVRPVSRLHTYGSLDTSWAKEETTSAMTDYYEVAFIRKAFIKNGKFWAGWKTKDETDEPATSVAFYGSTFNQFWFSMSPEEIYKRKREAEIGG